METDTKRKLVLPCGGTSFLHLGVLGNWENGDYD